MDVTLIEACVDKPVVCYLRIYKFSTSEPAVWDYAVATARNQQDAASDIDVLVIGPHRDAEQALEAARDYLFQMTLSKPLLPPSEHIVASFWARFPRPREYLYFGQIRTLSL